MRALALVTMLLVSGPSCVIGRQHRASGLEAAQGASGVAVTGGPLAPVLLAEDGEQAPESARSDAVWVRGYWHWDGVRYVWQRGHWQSSASRAR